MKVWYSKYKLDPVRKSSKVNYSNEGVLLKYEDSTYSLYHPIESLGDIPIDDFIKNLNKETTLNAKVKNLRCDLNDFLKLKSKKIRSYYSAPSMEDFLKNHEKLETLGFTFVKIKTKSLQSIEDNLEFLEKTSFKYIFDFNGREKKVSFEKASENLKVFLIKRVLYLEDPSKNAPFVKNVVIASDFIDYGDVSKIKVIKPTGFNHKLPEFEPSQSVVTSYLDHPFGQLIAALWALNNEITLDCGLHSHTYYKPNEYSKLFTDSPYFDFDKAKLFFSLLEKEKWSLAL